MLTRKTFTALIASAFAVRPGDFADRVKIRDANDPDLVVEARSALKAEIEDHVKDFVTEATSAELFFLKDVLMRREGSVRLVGAELPLLDAFQETLDRKTRYVEVPAEYSERTALFVEGLADARAAAKA